MDFEIQKLNELLRAPFDFCAPTVKVEVEGVPCVDSEGRENHVILMNLAWKFMQIKQMKCICV